MDVYGATGYIGSTFYKMYPENLEIRKRNDRIPKTNNILYFISTTDNYNVFDNITLDVDTNLKVLCEVLDYCRSSNITFNFISSWFVYGDTKLPAKETYQCNPTGFYSITKKAAEDLLISFCRTYNCKYRILRLCNVMGGLDSTSSKKKNAITYMINSLKNNEDVNLYDGGTPLRDILHVEDVCKAIKLIIDTGKLNSIYNVGRGKPTKLYDIINTAKEYLNSSSKIKSIESPQFHKIVQAKHFWSDTTKLKELGFVPTYTINDIIKELCTN